MGPVFADPGHYDAARVVVGLLAARPVTPDATERVAADLGVDDLTSRQVAAGAAILLDRVLADVTGTLRLDRSETVAMLGAWVARDEWRG